MQKGGITGQARELETVAKLASLKQRILIPTTNSGYGVGEKGKHCTEETPLRPISLYGRLKVDAENAILDAQGGITLRLATAFGISPRMRWGSVISAWRLASSLNCRRRSRFFLVGPVSGVWPFSGCLNKPSAASAFASLSSATDAPSSRGASPARQP